MATLYADRAFLSVNGAKIVDLQSMNLNNNYNAKAVPNMTTDGYNTGFVQGNHDIDIDFEVAIENALASPKIEEIDFGANSVQLNVMVGADQYVAQGLFRKTSKTSAAGIGQEAKKSWTFGALRLTDVVGNSILFPLTLSLQSS
jgi:hypothetical protein